MLNAPNQAASKGLILLRCRPRELSGTFDCIVADWVEVQFNSIQRQFDSIDLRFPVRDNMKLHILVSP